MKWITREHVKVDRVACPWLIKKFVDPDAEFHFVPAEQVILEANRLNATSFDVPGVELGHYGKECSFDAILNKHNFATDPALQLLGKIVNAPIRTPRYGINPRVLDYMRSPKAFRI